MINKFKKHHKKKKKVFFLFRPIVYLFRPISYLIEFSRHKIEKSIILELMFVFGISFLCTIIMYNFSNSYFTSATRYSVVKYDKGIKEIYRRSLELSDTIVSDKLNSKEDIKRIQNIIDSYYNDDTTNRIMIADFEGKVLFKSSNVIEEEINIDDVIRNNIDLKDNIEYSSPSSDGRKEYMSINPVSFSDTKAYAIIKGVPRKEVQYYTKDISFLASLLSVTTFIGTFLFLTKRKMKYIKELSSGLLQISKGNLGFKVTKRGNDELALLADNINYMAKELKEKIEKERKAEKTKNELITNVSHDLRTPLTSIMGYLGLIKDKKYENEDQLYNYVNISYNKSEKLKTLINDLFEYTKYSNDNNQNQFENQVISLGELLEQLAEELVPICEDNNVTIKKEIEDYKTFVEVDPDKTVRVFENLLMNAVRYSLKPGEIGINLYKEKSFVIVAISNQCKEISQDDLNKMFDRFYRLEKSRSTSTGGSGLGLAIAKNIVESQNGKIWAEYKDEKVIFYVKFLLV